MERWFPPNRGEPTGFTIVSRRGSERSQFLARGQHPFAGADVGLQDFRRIGEISLAILPYGKGTLSSLSSVLDQAIDTSTPSGKLLFDVLAAVAEFERGLIVERTLAGLRAARRRGKKLGRPKARRDPRLLARVRRLRKAGRSLAEVGQVLGVSKSMAAKLVREADA
jgi:hypothetical protein